MISIVASKCVDPVSKLVYTPTMIEKALAELSAKKREEGEENIPRWSGVTDKKSSKAQALEAIKALVHHQPIAIARARMRLKVVAPKRVKEKVMEFIEQVEDEGYDGGNWECTAFVEPGKYKSVTDLVASETKGKGRVEVLDTAVSTPLFSELFWTMFWTRS